LRINDPGSLIWLVDLAAIKNSDPFVLVRSFLFAAALLAGSVSLGAQQAPLGGWPQHSRARPVPPVVTPPTLVTLPPPPDAVVLFDGASLDRWTHGDGTPAKWTLVNGAMQVAPGTGALFTKDSVGDVQLHIEWMAPNPPKGMDQDRGNSGVFFGDGRYEVQVLDSWHNTTYADGQAAAIYGQYPPLVNASRPPGTWQSYDIIYTRPRFTSTGTVQSPAVITVWHNGVLVQDHRSLVGPTANGSRPPYEKHPDRLRISLQDHEHPVRFRNIWYRPLEAGRDETVQVRSAQGELYRAQADTGPVARARAALGSDYRDANRVIALGVAQSGARQFREAIETFTKGLAALPAARTADTRKTEAMLLRWRGHRYLSVREFAKAEADLTRGIALDTTNYGLFFHLGVLRYIQGRFGDAATMFARAQPKAPDGGERAGSTDWLWLSLSRAGRTADAQAMLDQHIDAKPDPKPAPAGYAYVSRLKLYRGEVTPTQLITSADTADVQIATLNYGLGAWALVRGDTLLARASFEKAMAGGGWPGFAFMAAEADLARLTKPAATRTPPRRSPTAASTSRRDE
jgi:tetratricopeptide (TPR) repeat protein